MPPKKKPKFTGQIIPCGTILDSGKACQGPRIRKKDGEPGYEDKCYQCFKKPPREMAGMLPGTQIDLPKEFKLENLEDIKAAQADITNRVATGAMPTKMGETLTIMLKSLKEIVSKCDEQDLKKVAQYEFTKERAIVMARNMTLEQARRISAEGKAALNAEIELDQKTITVEPITKEINKEVKEIGNENIKSELGIVQLPPTPRSGSDEVPKSDSTLPKSD